jgi:hypothetical protein
MEKNPRFWAWMCQQGINLQHVKDSWATIRSLQYRFMQENSSAMSNTPPQPLTPSDEWVRNWLLPWEPEYTLRINTCLVLPRSSED